MKTLKFSRFYRFTLSLTLLVASSVGGMSRAEAKPIEVVTTLPDYASVARFLGGDLLHVRAVTFGDQDAHFVRPKPSFATWMKHADLFVTTGLDLELWVPSLMDKAGNPRIRQGQIGYVSAADGIKLGEIPKTIDRNGGGCHIFGNPHVHTSPLNMKQVAKNITIGLIKVDPAHSNHYQKRLKIFQAKIDKHMFGQRLVHLLGGKTLQRLARSGNLVPFLKKRKFKGAPMLDLLGGWAGQMLPLYGKKIVTYHRNWWYFKQLFGLEVIGEVEPKPAIPPSPRDVERLIQKMKSHHVQVVLAANYFDEHKVKTITRAVGGIPVIVPMSVRGAKGAGDYFKLVDMWVKKLNEAFKQTM